MRDRYPSLADNLIDTHVLLDGRYRLESLVRRSATTTVHVATHRNGSTAWLKLPLSAAHADLLALEATIANHIGAALIVRDDGKTPEGLPYLILDPPDARSVAALRAGTQKGEHLPLARVMTIGDALARVMASIHGIGYATPALEDEDVLVFANGDVALLHLHALVPANARAVADDVANVRRVLAAMIAEVSDLAHGAPPPEQAARRAIEATLAAGYPDIAGFQAAWRAASPAPIAPPSRRAANSIGDFGSAPTLVAPMNGLAPTWPEGHPALGHDGAPHDTPHALSIGAGGAGEPEPSIIGFLKSSDGMEPPSSGLPSVERPVMYDPLTKHSEMPRLVTETSANRAQPARPGRALVAVLVAAPLLALIAGVGWLVLPTSRAKAPAPTALALAVPGQAADPAAAAPDVAGSKGAPASSAPVAREAAPAAKAAEPAAATATGAILTTKDDDLELFTLLRTDGAPEGRDVFIDGKSVGKTPLRAHVTCGTHFLQMVAGAPKQRLELPCGGERVVRYDAKGHWTVK